MCENNLQPKLRNVQRTVKALRRDIVIYNRRLMQTAVILSRIEREEEILLQKLYPDDKITRTYLRQPDTARMRFSKVIKDLQGMSPEDLQNFIDFTEGE